MLYVSLIIDKANAFVNNEMEVKKMRLDRKKLVCAMIDADMNTKQLAEKAGVARATACSIKNGKSCNYDTAEKLANALCISVTELIEK